MIQFKEMREKAGLTQEVVSRKLELKDKSTISKWETGKSAPTFEMLPKVAELYGCTIDELYGYTNPTAFAPPTQQEVAQQ